MLEISEQFDIDWGATGSEWTGAQVQAFIKNNLKAIINAINAIDGNGSAGGGESKFPEISIDEEGYLTVDGERKGEKSIVELVNESQDETFSSEDKAEIEYMVGCNKVNTVVAIPTNKRLVKATISTSETFSMAETIEEGKEIHIIISNTSEEPITIALPDSGNYFSAIGTDLNIKEQSYGEINIISDGDKMYIRAAS